MKIGIVSIERGIDTQQNIVADVLYEAIGKNTGNLMFTEAAFHLLSGDTKHIGFSFNPDDVNKSCDIVVVPAANWLNKFANWDWLIDLLEKLKVPVVVIGLGLQSSSLDIGEVDVSDSAIRLARFFARSAPLISVRGNFTRDWLHSIGIGNVVTTGCPSLYMNIFGDLAQAPSNRIVLQATRYGVSKAFAEKPSIDQKLFRDAARFDMPMIYQSEMEEIFALIYGRPEEDTAKAEALASLYGLESAARFEEYLRRNGKVFLDLKAWSQFVQQGRGVVGTRLHGSIIALNSGRPAVLVPHDSRTAEVADFAAIPTLDKTAFLKMETLDDYLDALRNADVDKYVERRTTNQTSFRSFLEHCGLTVNQDALF